MSTTAKGLFITALGVFIMSFESLLIKATNIQPFEFSFYIGLCMFLSMAIILFFKKKNILTEIKKPDFKIVLLGTTFMAMANLCFIAANKNTLASNVVLIIATAPLFTTFFAFVFYKVKPKKNIFIASFFIFVGLFIIFGGNLGVGNLLGNFYALLCTLFLSIFFVILSRHTNFDRSLLICIAGLILAIITFFLTSSFFISSHDLIFVLLMGLLVTPISRLFITYGTKYINASEASILMIIETLMAPIWVWLFLDEMPYSSTFIGGAIIVLTLILNSLYLMKKSK